MPSLKVFRVAGGLCAARLLLAGVFLTGCGSADPAPISVDHLTAPERAANLLSVTEHFGPLHVTAGEFDATSPVKPWSAWWYPSRETYLFQGTGGVLSPLEKYDAYSRKVHHEDPGAAAYERANLYDPRADSWEGLCHAWSVASLMEPEPVKPLVAGGITFGVGDQKALVVKIYEKVTAGAVQYGQRNNASRDSVADDIYPDQFHRFLQAQLFERGRPFIMDKDPGVAVWNTPVWQAQVSITRDAGDPHLAHVSTWLAGASPFVDSYDFVGTLAVNFQYTYDLYGYPAPDGGWDVQFGLWTGDSLNYHPDFVTELPEQPGALAHESRNTQIKADWVAEITGKLPPPSDQ